MIIHYECDSCGEYNVARCLISRCEACGDEICTHCQEKGKDGNYYCEDCIDEVNIEYEEENNINDNEEERRVYFDE